MEHRKYNAINQSVRKKDSRQLLLGKPVYVDDLTGDALVVKLLRSPHANAVIDEINTSVAKKVPGCGCTDGQACLHSCTDIARINPHEQEGDQPNCECGWRLRECVST